MTSNINTHKPFLRWVGGKQKIIKKIEKFLPIEEFDRYWEPFLGSGAFFFAINPISANLLDKNINLINSFINVRDNPSLVYYYLNLHIQQSSEAYYYKIREIYNNSLPSLEQSARFIYLNRTCFNGIFRVNQQGLYNVPYGFKEPPPIISLEDLVCLSNLLKNANIKCLSYDKIDYENEVLRGDFFYLDPPYPHYFENGTSFNHYSIERFGWKDHEKLADIANILDHKNCKVMISYLDEPRIRSLYKNWNFNDIKVMRYISGNGCRKLVPEIVLTNY